MSDLGALSPELLLARIDVERDAQHIVIEGKELRLAEIDAEEVRLAADDERVALKVAEIAAKVETVEDAIEVRRERIKKHEYEHIVRKNRLRLLELAEERAAVLLDITASETHIARLEAEERQQKTRLKERAHG